MDSPLPQNYSQGSTSSDEETSFRFKGLLSHETEAESVLQIIVVELRSHAVADIQRAAVGDTWCRRMETTNDCLPECTLHVDAFLYNDEDDVEKLVDQGKISRNFCAKCGNRNTQYLTFSSHIWPLVRDWRTFSPRCCHPWTARQCWTWTHE